MEKLVGEHIQVALSGVLVLNMAQMKQFRDETVGDEGNMLRALCKMVTRENMMLIDPIRMLTNHT